MTPQEKIAAYRVTVRPVAESDGGGFEAVFPQLSRMVVGYGASQADAVEDLMAGVPLLVESVVEAGETLPDPDGEAAWKDYSGRVTLRLPKSLHQLLDILAEREGTSLNTLMATLLQAGATSLSAGLPFGAEPSSAKSRNRLAS